MAALITDEILVKWREQQYSPTPDAPCTSISVDIIFLTININRNNLITQQCNPLPAIIFVQA